MTRPLGAPARKQEIAHPHEVPGRQQVADEGRVHSQLFICWRREPGVFDRAHDPIALARVFWIQIHCERSEAEQRPLCHNVVEVLEQGVE